MPHLLLKSFVKRVPSQSEADAKICHPISDLPMDDLDTRIRLRAFSFLEDLCSRYGLALPREVLLSGFDFEGKRVPLLSPQGIFKPAVLPEIPLSITTVPVVEGKSRPYEDEIGPDGLMRYKYRGTDPMHRDNLGLRLAMQRQTPLIYFYGLVPGRYAAIWPVRIIGENQGNLSFSVEVEDKQNLIVGEQAVLSESIAQPEYAARAYITVATQVRLHQHSFRMRVLQAYRECCAVCRLKHVELLEAAHILPDSNPRGEPWVSNGISLCKLHHAAFDSQLMGIRPDLVVEIRKDILDESDGPLLIHGLKEWHNKRLIVIPHSPGLKPRADFLEERFEMFRRAC